MAETAAVDPGLCRASGTWTRSEITTLIEMWPDHGNDEIARHLNRAPNAVAIKASRLGLPPRVQVRAAFANNARGAQRAGAKVRPCLRCKTSFFSDGAHHRICDKCKSGDAWASGSGSYISGLETFQ